MELDGSLVLQEPTTIPYPKPDESTPHLPMWLPLEWF
jgi:hypothetical protein